MNAAEEFDLNSIEWDVPLPLPQPNSFVPPERRLSMDTNLSNRQPVFARCRTPILFVMANPNAIFTD